MVVVSGSWVKNVATYPTPANDNDMVISTPNNTMTAKAILICRPNSHPFQERTLALDQPIKVGRSVARARATSTNAIFDCKVLSRHHALLWYDNGKFYLQDTKSSNGTFVNNNRLSTSDSEPHEVCSGDIVQFGVDVVENNRKVTHCCIVATLKLYLADGKEAKASPSITESSRHGLVPLDELYKLNQIIQEACQREQCLESKLTALQHIVDDTRRSADESWQAYIGEERLLSRLATLENQLAQASKNVTDDRLREELTKLHEEKTLYQVTAKEALRKLHAEQLEAVALATEQKRAKATAEQEANLAKDQLAQLQQELQDLALKLMSEQKRSDEDKAELEQRERELQARLESESKVVDELQTKLEHFKTIVNNPIKELLPLEELEKCSLIYTDGLKTNKDEYLGENETGENMESEYMQTNRREEPDQNHINLRVSRVDKDGTLEEAEVESSEDEEMLESIIEAVVNTSINAHLSGNQTTVDSDDEMDEKEENEKEHQHTSDLAKESLDNLQTHNGNGEIEEKEDDFGKYKERGDMGKIDSKTLKYHFQSLQNELKKQIEQLQQQSIVNRNKIVQLETALAAEKHLNEEKHEECSYLKQELDLLQRKTREIDHEIDGKIASWHDEHDMLASNDKTFKTNSDNDDQACNTNSIELNSSISNSSLTVEQVTALEEELVILKERYAAVNDEKLFLNKNLLLMQDQYSALCNRSHNTMFFYIAPLVLIVLYLLISQHFS